MSWYVRLIDHVVTGPDEAQRVNGVTEINNDGRKGDLLHWPEADRCLNGVVFQEFLIAGDVRENRANDQREEEDP